MRNANVEQNSSHNVSYDVIAVISSEWLEALLKLLLISNWLHISDVFLMNINVAHVIVDYWNILFEIGYIGTIFNIQVQW